MSNRLKMAVHMSKRNLQSLSGIFTLRTLQSAISDRSNNALTHLAASHVFLPGTDVIFLENLQVAASSMLSSSSKDRGRARMK